MGTTPSSLLKNVCIVEFQSREEIVVLKGHLTSARADICLSAELSLHKIHKAAFADCDSWQNKDSSSGYWDCFLKLKL